MTQAHTVISSAWLGLLPRLARFLPANLFNRLRSLPEDLGQATPDTQAQVSRSLLEITRTLDPLHRVLVQYMPRYLNDLDPTPGRPYGELLTGSFIFADVTGFTALTELLARQGQARGRELMNEIMNRLFTEMLDPLIASGGDLLIFAGDAALVYFPKQDHDEDILQAIRAALRMQRAIRPFASFETEYGLCSLTMSAGVERGLAYAGVVGSQKRMELLVSGPGIDGAMQAEVQAEPGQVMLGEQAQAVAKDYFTLQGAWIIDDLGDALGDYEILIPTRKRGGSVFMSVDVPELLTTIETALQRVERLAPFLPEDMLAHLVNTDRHRKLVSEFRPVAVQFIHVVGLEALAIEQGPEVATAVFQRYFVRVQEIINQHEGIISQIDAYAGGFFFLNTFGTPKAHEGTTRYAVSAALQLARVLEEINKEFKLVKPLKQRGGITYGLVFNGEVGAKYRRESVVAGPAVNRAARLMSKAEFGQVILDFSIWEDTRTAFVGEQLPAVNLKGIDGPVVIVNVHEIRRGTRLQPLQRPLLGREAEQARLAQAHETLLNRRQGSAWMVYGETGIGKTSLISDLAEKARKQPEITILAGRCQPHGKHIPLFVWIDLLTGWLDVAERADHHQERVRLAARLEELGMADAENALAGLLALTEPAAKESEISPAATESSPPNLKASLLRTLNQKVAAPEPAATAAVKSGGDLNSLLGQRLGQSQPQAQTLWKRLEERITGPGIIIKLLRRLAQKQPLLIILEDIHWLDRESETLLKNLLARAANPPILFVLTGRTPFDHPALSMINLPGLSNPAITQAAQRALGAQVLDGSLAEWICSQAGGNPLYAQELCQALRQTDAIFLDKETGEVRWTKEAPALPLSLHELMLARLDELPLDQQELLKRAAVMGISFEYEGLLHLNRDRLAEIETKTALEQIVQAGFLIETENKSYRFSHPLMQEAIYTTLSFTQRQSWHTRIGSWLSEQQPEPPLELIAYHALHGHDVQKAAGYALKAGDKAREQGAYAGALEYYEQVLSLQEAPLEARRRAAERLGDLLAAQKDYRAARQAYLQAAELKSVTAAAKQAILSGDIEQLEQVETTDELQAWVAASRAWLLAQEGRFEAALDAARVANELANDEAKEEMGVLLETLEKKEASGSYESWLQRLLKIRGVLY